MISIRSTVSLMYVQIEQTHIRLLIWNSLLRGHFLWNSLLWGYICFSIQADEIIKEIMLLKSKSTWTTILFGYCLRPVKLERSCILLVTNKNCYRTGQLASIHTYLLLRKLKVKFYLLFF